MKKCITIIIFCLILSSCNTGVSLEEDISLVPVEIFSVSFEIPSTWEKSIYENDYVEYITDDKNGSKKPD